MARWADHLSEEEEVLLLALLRRLVAEKPRGWSVIRGDRELILRPASRSVGKLSITVAVSRAEPTCYVSFFSRSLNHWDGHEYFALSADSAGTILEWAQERVAREIENGPADS